VNCGGFVRLEVRDTPPANLQTDLASVVKEAADVLTTGTASLADGVISDNDYRAISKELHELQEALQRAQCALDAAHKGGLRAVRT
jgi:hypothetical protein